MNKEQTSIDVLNKQLKIAFGAVKKDISRIQERIELIDSNSAKKELLKEAVKEFKELKAKVSDVEKRESAVVRVEEKLDSKNEELKELKKIVQSLEKNGSKRFVEKDTYDKELDEFNTDLTSVEKEVTGIKKELEKFKRVKDTIDSFDEKINEKLTETKKPADTKEAMQKMESVENRLEYLENELDEQNISFVTKDEVSELNKELAKLSKKIENMRELNQDEFEETLSSESEKMRRISNEIEALKKEASKAKEINELKEELKFYEIRMNGISKIVDKVGHEMITTGALVKELKRLRKQIAKANLEAGKEVFAVEEKVVEEKIKEKPSFFGDFYETQVEAPKEEKQKGKGFFGKIGDFFTEEELEEIEAEEAEKEEKKKKKNGKKQEKAEIKEETSDEKKKKGLKQAIVDFFYEEVPEDEIKIEEER